ncbi:MAG: hypothetical protein NVSMB45_07970 [Ginsengibacter sp.]
MAYKMYAQIFNEMTENRTMAKQILLLFTFIFILQSLFSQIAMPNHNFSSLGDIDVAFSKIMNFNSLPAGQKKVDDLYYDDVQGSPFWSNDWNTAVFVLENGGMAKAKKTKLDLFANEIHFLNSSNIELSFDNSQIKKVYFFKGADSNKVIALFESLIDPLSNKNAYYKVLNGGQLRLLEQIKILVKENDYNPAVGKKEYSFYSKVNYAIADNEKVIPLKSLSESSLFSVIFKSTEYYEWLKQNDNHLKTEYEFISFFSYVNNREKK